MYRASVKERDTFTFTLSSLGVQINDLCTILQVFDPPIIEKISYYIPKDDIKSSILLSSVGT
jgi:hypothetical protein